MMSYLDLLCLEWLWSRKNAELNPQIARFADGDGVETDVLEGCSTSCVGDGTIYRTDGQDIPDAPPQPAMNVKRGECTAPFGEMRCRGICWNFAVLKRRQDGLVRQSKQLGAFFGRELAAVDLVRLHSGTMSRQLRSHRLAGAQQSPFYAG